jgi:hypothetical protein
LRGRYNRLVVRDAWRIEAPHLWDRFYVARDAMLRLGARLWEQRQRTFPAVQLRPPFLDATSALEGSKSLVGAANEVYLLHGTRPETVRAVSAHGWGQAISPDDVAW